MVSEEMMKELNVSGDKAQFSANDHFSRCWKYPHHRAVLLVCTAVTWSLPVKQTAPAQKELGCVMVSVNLCPSYLEQLQQRRAQRDFTVYGDTHTT